MLEINIDKTNEDPDVKKINIGNGLMWLEYNSSSEDQYGGIFMHVSERHLSGDKEREGSNKIELFRLDDSYEDTKQQKELCNKLITALKFAEKNWF